MNKGILFFVSLLLAGPFLSAQPANTPDWVGKTVFYQVYPQTFFDTNGDGVGDLEGIIQKLDYLRDLGVGCLWINPFYVSPFRDAGYDVADYYTVDARYGSNDDARRLFEEAHARGLKIIIDFVPGHTSIDHPWFQKSCEPKPNSYSNWYIWTHGTWFPGMEKYAEKFVQGYCDRDGNYMTNFFWHQPALNFGFGQPDPSQPWQLPADHPDILALRAEMKKILRYWLDMGCDGFRVDMAGSLVKDDKDQRIREFWHEIRSMFDQEYPQCFMISEWSHPENAISAGFHCDFMHWFSGYNDLFQKESYRVPFSQGHSFFDKQGKGSITDFLAIYSQQVEAVGGKGYISLPVGNHDLIRINNGGRSDADLEIIQAFNLTMPNVPFIYYGDEIGMRQLEGLQTKEGAYGTRAGARTPMQWARGANLGFSTASADKLYFPTDASADAPTVEAQQADPNSLLSRIKTLIALRRTENALSADAAFVPLFANEGAYPFIYARRAGRETIVVVLNPSQLACTARFAFDFDAAKARRLAGHNHVELRTAKGYNEARCEGRSYAIFKYLAKDISTSY